MKSLVNLFQSFTMRLDKKLYCKSRYAKMSYRTKIFSDLKILGADLSLAKHGDNEYHIYFLPNTSIEAG